LNCSFTHARWPSTMTSTHRFTALDLLKFNTINLDPLTETYNIAYYFKYLAYWPEYFLVQKTPDGVNMGYVMGKVEGSKKRDLWHGHVTAVTVGPSFRRLGVASNLMDNLETITSNIHHGYFVDLFVRVSNKVAIGMYERMGYVIYRRILDYYGDEDGYDMRKAMPRDKNKTSMIPLKEPVHPNSMIGEYDNDPIDYRAAETQAI